MDKGEYLSRFSFGQLPRLRKGIGEARLPASLPGELWADKSLDIGAAIDALSDPELRNPALRGQEAMVAVSNDIQRRIDSGEERDVRQQMAAQALSGFPFCPAVSDNVILHLRKGRISACMSVTCIANSSVKGPTLIRPAPCVASVTGISRESFEYFTKLSPWRFYIVGLCKALSQ